MSAWREIVWLEEEIENKINQLNQKVNQNIDQSITIYRGTESEIDESQQKPPVGSIWFVLEEEVS